MYSLIYSFVLLFFAFPLFSFPKTDSLYAAPFDRLSNNGLQSKWNWYKKFNQGGEVRNGGDLVKCNLSTETSYQGWYSLDYLATLGMDQEGKTPLVPVQSLLDSLSRIESALRRHDSNLAGEFHDFIKYFLAPGDLNAPTLWIATAFGFQNLADEHIIQHLPINCYSMETGFPQLIQAVFRRTLMGREFYYYDQDLFTFLSQERPQQLSFLLVHEWLWKYTQDIDCSRLVNYFLHSTWLDSTESISLSTLNCHLNSRRSTTVHK